MVIRPFALGDEKDLLNIFYTSIRENAKDYYKEVELKAWAPDDMELDKWREKMLKIRPFVLEIEGVILAYADLQMNGYIDHFFVKGGQNGRGYGKILMEYLIYMAKLRGIHSLTSDVSLAAQAFYMKFGFEIVERKEVDVRGIIKLENASMKLVLD